VEEAVMIRAWAPAVLLLMSCGDKDDTGAPATPAGEPCGEPCVLEDAHQFSYETDLQATNTDAQAEADVCLDWSGFSTDIQGHAVAEDITKIRLVVFGTLTQDEILDGLASDALQQSDVSLYMICEPESGDTDCCLSEFGLAGSYPGIDTYFTEGSGSWMFSFDSDGVDGARTLAFLTPQPDSTTTTVDIGNETASLSMDVDLQSSVQALVGAGSDVTVDWSGLTADGLGNELAHEKINLLEVARYDEDLATLESNFFDLKTMASESWSMSVAGETSASLADLEGDSAFEGIDGDHTWLLVLWCSVCENPVPKAMVVLGLDE